MSATFTTHSNLSDVFISQDRNDTLRKGLENYMKVVAGNPLAFLGLTEFGIISGHKIDSCCAPVSDDILRKVLEYYMNVIVWGRDREINGKMDHWSVGFLGSQWMDIDAKQFGVTHIRASFVSKKTHVGEWKSDKPVIIRVQVEKAR